MLSAQQTISTRLTALRIDTQGLMRIQRQLIEYISKSQGTPFGRDLRVSLKLLSIQAMP